MTVSTTATRDQFTGDGVTVSLPTTFAFNAASEIKVTSRVILTGVETVLSITTHYTVAGGAYDTGTITVVDPATDFPSTVEWTVERVTPLSQETDWVEGDIFPAQSHERAADKLTFIAQERDDKVDRSLRAPTTDAAAIDMELPNSVDRASLFLAFDADGEPIASAGVTPATVTVSGFGADLIDDLDADAARVTLDAQEAVITAQGDLVVGDSTPEASVLPIGAAGSYLKSDGTDPEWVAAAEVALPRSYLAGLAMSNDTDADHDIAIAVGECRDSSHAVNVALAAILTKQLDATWAAGDDAGGLNATDFAAGGSGPEVSTMYHVFLIKHADGTVDAGFDKDVDATNLLSDSGYTYYRRVGTIFTDGSENILGFTQVGDTFLWDDPPMDVNVTNLGTTDTNYALSVAPYAMCMLNVRTEAAVGSGLIYLRSTAQDDESPSTSAAPFYTVYETADEHANAWVKADASSEVRAVADASARELEVVTLWYIDRRGRDE